MKKHHFITYLLLVVSLQILAQNDISIKEHYHDYFKAAEEETVFVHLNKTTYLVGEEIWFKGYIFNKRSEEISRVSTNLYVGLYDADGEQVSKKLVRIQHGSTHGNLELAKNLRSGVYYIKAATQQMIDKQSEDVFIEEILIYGKNTLVTQPNKAEVDTYDIQFLPEGGHIVNNVENTIAFKAIDQTGKGIYVNGRIYDENNNEITTFESNNYGIGTFKIAPKNNNSYTAKITFEEEKTSEKTLPIVENTGIAIQVDNLEKDSVKISFNTNQETLRSIVSKKYTLLIHKDGWSRSMPFSFKNTEKVALSIARNRLFHGVNTITLFDGKTPVLERLFFNKKVTKNLSVMVKKTETKNNSSAFAMYLVKKSSRIQEADVSISIVPETSEAYNPAHNIFSSFYLKPYIRGAIENPKYYFPNNTKSKRKALDALLITQGWSKYNWEKIFQKQPKKQPLENGITIRGIVNFPVKHVTGVFLYDTKDAPAQYIPIDKERNFVVHNLFPEAGEKLRFSYINHKKEFLKPKLYLRFNVTNEKEKLSNNINIDRTFLHKNTFFTLPDGFFPEDAEALDAVLLSGFNKHDNQQKTIDPTMVTGKETKIGMEEYLRYPNITDLINNSGFEVIEHPLDRSRLDIKGRRVLTLQGDGKLSPLLFVDDVPQSSFDILRHLSSANVERVVISVDGIGYGLRGSGGVIKVYTRKTPLTKISETKKDSYASHVAPIGFSVAKEYYVPKYRSFTDETYQKYGAIDWRPNNTIPRRGAFNFLVKHKGVKGITMYIEGISRDGSLISEKRTITIANEEE